MKIVISSDILNGIIVSRESGEGFFKAKSLEELLLFLEGVKKGCPGAEFVFKNNPALGAVYETGRAYGEKIKEDCERYRVYLTDKGLVVTIHTDGLNSCLEGFKLFSSDPNIENYILIDNTKKIVEILKGTIVPFKKILDMVLPGWKVGKIKRE